MSQPFNKALGDLRHMAALASLSVETSPWRALSGMDRNSHSVFVANGDSETIAVVIDRFYSARQPGQLFLRSPMETLRNAMLIAEAPLMRQVCEALAHSGPDVAQTLAYHQVQVPAEMALATHLARAIMGRLGS